MKIDDTTDLWIYIVTVLFTLSVITEKLTQLVRNYPVQSKWLTIVITLVFSAMVVNSLGDLKADLIWFCVLLIITTIVLSIGRIRFRNPFTKRPVSLVAFQNIRKGSGNKRAQEREVTVLSLLLGLIVATIFNINLVDLLQAKSEEITADSALPVDLTSFEFVVTTLQPMAVLGFLLTGFFLTFGSKFFHDLLDLLLEVKNQRRNLNQHSQESEAQLIRLQLDNKASLLPHVSADQRTSLESEIQILRDRLTRLIAA